MARRSAARDVPRMPHEREDDPGEDERSSSSRHVANQVPKHLFKSRTVLLFGEVTTELAEATCAQILALAATGDDPIRVVIHSPGGHVEAGDTIRDVIRFVRPEVKMLGTGWVASAGALIYVAAERKNRFALPNTRFLLHQPLGGVRGRSSEIEIEAAQILAMRERLNRIFAEATGQPLEKITQETERNFWMTAQEALAYGLVGKIVQDTSDM